MNGVPTIHVQVAPQKVASSGCLCRWDGLRGGQLGVGCVQTQKTDVLIGGRTYLGGP